MRLRLGQFRRLVRLGLLEGSEGQPEVVLSDGDTAVANGPEHIKDMESVLAGLVSLKKQQKYGTLARARFADAHLQLKRILRRAENSGPAELDEIDDVTPEEPAVDPPRTFAKLEGEVMSPGRSGQDYGTMTTTSPGVARRKP